MGNNELGQILDTEATVLKLMKDSGFRYNRGTVPIEEMSQENRFLASLSGRWPTIDEVRQYAMLHGGILCRMYAFAAVDLLRERGIPSTILTLRDQTQPEKSLHVLVLYAGTRWLEPQTGKKGNFAQDGWGPFKEYYAKVCGFRPDGIVAACELSSDPRQGRSLKSDKIL